MARTGDGIYLRGTVWYLDFRWEGKRHVVRIGRNISKTVAREIAQVERAAILKGEAGIGRKRKDLSFDKAAELFLKSIEERVELRHKLGKKGRSPKTLQNYKENIRALKESFSGKTLSQINSFLLRKYRLKRKDAPTAFNREMACLSRIFNWCKEEKRFEGENPTTGIERFEETQRKRSLTRDEEQRLLAEAADHLILIVLLGEYTGLRVKSQILHLRKTDVHLNQGFLDARAANAKNKERLTVPLRPELVELLKVQMAKSKSEWVFVKDDGVTRRKSIRTAFEAACRRAKISDLRIHDLRHTFATRLVTEGKVDLITVKELGGWKRLDMVERYANPNDEHKVKAINSIQFTTLFTTPENSEITKLPQVTENK